MDRDRTPIYVEHHNGRPFSVITKGGEHYDFEYCKRDGLVYYNLSGTGGPRKTRLEAPRFCEPKKTVKGVRVWVRADMTLIDERGRTVRKHESRGYRLLKRLPGNPFERDDVCEGQTVHCTKCRDYLPDDADRPCAHLWWCDACCSWAGAADDPCKHETREASRAAYEKGQE